MKKSTKIKIWAWAMRMGNRCGCHQREDRSFHIKGWQFPICSRCTGILTGQIIGISIYLFHIRVPIILSLLFLGIMFLDWYLQYKKIKESTNVRRFITGNLAGIAQVSIILEIFLLIWSLYK
ncbi:MAG: DUF2085 domain-containing protein [Clostridia bacterium]